MPVPTLDDIHGTRINTMMEIGAARNCQARGQPGTHGEASWQRRGSAVCNYGKSEVGRGAVSRSPGLSERQEKASSKGLIAIPVMRSGNGREWTAWPFDNTAITSARRSRLSRKRMHFCEEWRSAGEGHGILERRFGQLDLFPSLLLPLGGIQPTSRPSISFSLARCQAAHAQAEVRATVRGDLTVSPPPSAEMHTAPTLPSPVDLWAGSPHAADCRNRQPQPPTTSTEVHPAGGRRTELCLSGRTPCEPPDALPARCLQGPVGPWDGRMPCAGGPEDLTGGQA
ncbi:hypothetical protein QBC39DRAFT_334049 [Podospora conica]|nr:hypothetical protein QBC39DRAFT_334049 [Schizothecium conicum]